MTIYEGIAPEAVFERNARSPDSLRLIPTIAHFDYEKQAYIGPESPFKISENPLLSVGYLDCNGVALLSGGYGALLHNNIGYHDVVQQLIDLIEDFSEYASLERTMAVLIGGRFDHAGENERVLARKGIRIVGRYVDGCDGAADDEGFAELQKDVLVLPREKEVLLRRIKLKDSYKIGSEKPWTYTYEHILRKIPLSFI